MTERLFRITRDGPGRLATMTRPRGGDWLPPDIDRLRTLGISMVVSALTPVEELELELDGEAATVVRGGLAYACCPIDDRGVPALALIDPLVACIGDHLGEGGYVAIHCRMGIGRSSLIAAAVLVSEGVSPRTAWERVADARGMPVPDTEAQRQWLAERFAAR